MKKILLLMPPNTMPLNNKAKRAIQPIGLMYIAAVLEKNGFTAGIIDTATDGWENEVIEGRFITYGLTYDEIKDKIKGFNPDIVGVSCAFSPQINNVHKTCKAVKEVNKKIVTVIGGLHPTVFPEESLKNDFVDYVVMGEGEYRMTDLVKRLNEKKNFDGFDGIAYKKNGSIIIQKPLSSIENLDELSYPARHLVNMEKYFEINMPFNPFPKGKRIIQMLTSRGCPIGCLFCASCNYWGLKYRARSAENVLSEIMYLKEKYGADEIQFADDQLILNKKRTKELLEGFKKTGIPHFSTPGGLYTNALDEELIKLLKESGFYQITLAIESADPYIQKNVIGKVVDLEKAKRLVKYAHKLDMTIHGFFVFGLPGETREQMKKSFSYAYELDVDSMSYYVAQPIPGSKLYDICIEKGLLETGSYEDLDLKSGVANLSEVDSKELEVWVSEECAKYMKSYVFRHPVKFLKKYWKYIFTNKNSDSNFFQNIISVIYSFKKSKN